MHFLVTLDKSPVSFFHFVESREKRRCQRRQPRERQPGTRQLVSGKMGLSRCVVVIQSFRHSVLLHSLGDNQGAGFENPIVRFNRPWESVSFYNEFNSISPRSQPSCGHSRWHGVRLFRSRATFPRTSSVDRATSGSWRRAWPSGTRGRQILMGWRTPRLQAALQPPRNRPSARRQSRSGWPIPASRPGEQRGWDAAWLHGPIVPSSQPALCRASTRSSVNSVCGLSLTRNGMSACGLTSRSGYQN